MSKTQAPLYNRRQNLKKTGKLETTLNK